MKMVRRIILSVPFRPGAQPGHDGHKEDVLQCDQKNARDVFPSGPLNFVRAVAAAHRWRSFGKAPFAPRRRAVE